jgi:ABC-2 type transport system permease protein
MNTQSNAIPDSPIASPEVTPAVVLEPRPFYWSLRRELWENRSLYIAPLAAAVLFLFGFLISILHSSARIRVGGPAPWQHMWLEEAYNFAALLIMGTTFIVAVFYCLDALHGERRDRSILFWKSLPVSDLTTVLSKAIIPLVILPLLTFAITIALWFAMLLISGLAQLRAAQSVATLWPFSFSQMSLLLLYHLVVIHGLWYAPFYGWMLLVSGWARRAAFLWAIVPPFVIGIVEKIAFNTSHFADMLGYHFSGGAEHSNSKATAMSALLIPNHDPAHLLINPSFWTGLVVTALFLAAAVQLRRYRGPI